MGVLALIAPVFATESYRQLSGREIKARFSGKELTDGVHWSMRLGAAAAHPLRGGWALCPGGEGRRSRNMARG